MAGPVFNISWQLIDLPLLIYFGFAFANQNAGGFYFYGAKGAIKIKTYSTL